MAEKRDYYEVLGVSKTATEDELKKAYRKLAKENHPDLHPGDKACEARFKEINEAYEILSDSDKRAKYDQFGHAAFDPSQGYGGGFGGFGDFGGFSGFGGFGDIFGDIFGFGGGGKSSNAPRKGDNIRASVNVKFEEAAFGTVKEIFIGRVEQCADCKGSGCAEGTTPEVCKECTGTGTVRTTQRTPFGAMQSTSPCPKCNGRGKIIRTPCKTCRGVGSVRRQIKEEVKIPAGIDDGQTISLRGQGNAGKNGGSAGDLLITVMVQPDETFRREGVDVFCEAPITFAQATLGATLEIPTIDGKVKYDLPEGTQTGSVFRLRGKGIPVLNGRGRGDQYVTVNVETPRNLTREQKEALRTFSDMLGESNYEKRKSFFKKK